MGTFNVSLKTLTDRVSMEVVYTPGRWMKSA